MYLILSACTHSGQEECSATVALCCSLVIQTSQPETLGSSAGKFKIFYVIIKLFLNIRLNFWVFSIIEKKSSFMLVLAETMSALWKKKIIKKMCTKAYPVLGHF